MSNWNNYKKSATRSMIKSFHLSLCSYGKLSTVEDLLILVDRKVAGSLNFFVNGTQFFFMSLF
jgi:hypothetical protein